MFSLVRRYPLHEFSDIQKTMDRFFDEAFGVPANQSRLVGNFMPASDVYETENEVVFACELPGFEKEDVNILVEDGQLTISGERKFERESRNYYRVERRYGKFQRSFVLPTTVQQGKISASLKNGVLTVTLPKREESKPKQISVTVN